jgi:hypothetical protein
MGGHNFWWHDSNEGERHNRIVQLVDRISNSQSYINSANLDHLKSYSRREYTEDGNGSVVPQGPSPYMGINATKSAIDTIISKLTQQDPRPHFKTEGGNWNARNRARKLQKFTDGVYYKSNFYAKARRACKDAAIFGTGFVKPYFESNEIKWERVWPGSVVVEEASAMNGNTRSFFQIDTVPLESLMAKFPDKAIDLVASNLSYKTTANGVVTAMVKVYEAWHLKDENGDGGRHTICTENCTLFDEECDLDCDPIIAFRWTEAPVGYYGHGAVEDVTCLQNEMDYVMQKIQAATHNGALVWVIKHISDTTPNNHLTNKICSIINYSGNQPPTVIQNRIMDQQVFDHVKWMNELIYNVTGVSAMSATSQKPKGIESGKALQTMLDVESQRFGEIQKNYEQFIVACTKACIALAKKHFTGGKTEYQVQVDNGRFTETIKWSEVNMDEDEYMLKVWPTNMLPATPAGKMDTVERMMQAGLIDALTGMMLLDFPDVEAHQGLVYSSVKQALWIVDQVIYEGKEIEPREWYDLDRCIKYMQMGLSNAEMEGAPEEVFERGMEFIASCQELLMPPPAPPISPAGMVPEGSQPVMSEAMPPAPMGMGGVSAPPSNEMIGMQQQMPPMQ